jgi:hypothetical protein
MYSRVAAAAVAVCFLAFAQGAISVNQLREFLKSSIQMKMSDVEVAKYLKTVKLSERLDDRSIEDLQGQGLGPKTVAALRGLRDATASLKEAKPEPPPPAPPPPKPPPSAQEQARILDEARDLAVNYSNRLPDYICWQVTRWYINPYGQQDSWIPRGHMTERLSYFDHHEDYKTITVNDVVSNVDARKLGRSLSRGEFGTMLHDIFDRSSRTDFEWSRWTGLRLGSEANAPVKWIYVFAFRVPLDTSKYTVEYDNGAQRIIAAYHGEIYIDKETNMVVRIKMFGDTPADFPVQGIFQQLDYDYTKIGDQMFLLPRNSEMQAKMDHGKHLVRNTIDFKHYEKFSTDTVIKFDQMTPDTEPTSDDQKKEQKPPQ